MKRAVFSIFAMAALLTLIACAPASQSRTTASVSATSLPSASSETAKPAYTGPVYGITEPLPPYTELTSNPDAYKGKHFIFEGMERDIKTTNGEPVDYKFANVQFYYDDSKTNYVWVKDVPKGSLIEGGKQEAFVRGPSKPLRLECEFTGADSYLGGPTFIFVSGGVVQ